MLVFAHAGLTLGVVRGLDYITAKLALSQNKLSQLLAKLSSGQNRSTHPSLLISATRNNPTSPNPTSHNKKVTSRPETRLIDYRLVLIGSLLPDIIDKPIGHLFFKSIFSNGRIFGHTLLFSLTLTFIGLYLYRQGKPGMLILSLCSLGHLILDKMWQDPVTLLWPMYGWSFPKADLANWLSNIFHALRTDPSVYIPELIGALIIMHFTLMLIKKKEIHTLITHGVMRQFSS